ncbi:hypothetical protein [Marinobacter mangrovi]|uniref:hypothetical protein n=1 Tax=Marinobacter mangrovi TaxID=2803918 RepID=UPI0019341F9B|nr:hypothetical protein [Marinobacter mangrovi]
MDGKASGSGSKARSARQVPPDNLIIVDQRPVEIKAEDQRANVRDIAKEQAKKMAYFAHAPETGEYWYLGKCFASYYWILLACPIIASMIIAFNYLLWASILPVGNLLLSLAVMAVIWFGLVLWTRWTGIYAHVYRFNVRERTLWHLNSSTYSALPSQEEVGAMTGTEINDDVTANSLDHHSSIGTAVLSVMTEEDLAAKASRWKPRTLKQQFTDLFGDGGGWWAIGFLQLFLLPGLFATGQFVGYLLANLSLLVGWGLSRLVAYWLETGLASALSRLPETEGVTR